MSQEEPPFVAALRERAVAWMRSEAGPLIGRSRQRFRSRRSFLAVRAAVDVNVVNRFLGGKAVEAASLGRIAAAIGAEIVVAQASSPTTDSRA